MNYDKEKIKKTLVQQTDKIIKIINKEYKDLVRMPNYNNLEEVIHIENIGTVSLFVKNGNFYFPSDVFKIFSIWSKMPGYGSNKKHKTCNQDNLIINDNTYETFIKHVFIAGLTPEQYFLEILLHETLHFSGSGGGTALREGINELKTRQLALKYDFITSGCGYPKETKIAYELEQLFGEEIINRIAFSKNNHQVEQILESISPEAVNLYFSLENKMEDEFYKKYMRYNFPGLTGPIKKVKCYNSINYKDCYEMIDKYKQKFLKKTK